MQTLWEHFEVFLQCLSCCTGARSSPLLPEISSRISCDYFNINKSLPDTFMVHYNKKGEYCDETKTSLSNAYFSPPVQILRKTGWTALRHETGGGRCSSGESGHSRRWRSERLPAWLPCSRRRVSVSDRFTAETNIQTPHYRMLCIVFDSALKRLVKLQKISFQAKTPQIFFYFLFFLVW